MFSIFSNIFIIKCFGFFQLSFLGNLLRAQGEELCVHVFRASGRVLYFGIFVLFSR